MSSELSRFYQLPVSERRALLASRLDLTQAEVNALAHAHGLLDDQADRMVENALGVFSLPLGLCVNLRINGQDVLAPMAVEEPSVIAAASHAAKLLRSGDGILADASPPHMIGQIQVLDIPDLTSARAALSAHRDALLADANACDPLLSSLGGGAFDIELRTLNPLPGEDDPLGPMLIVHLLVDVRDAMGANAVNTMCERLAPQIEGLTGGRVRLRILSNLADRRTITVTGRVPYTLLDGKGEKSGEALALGIQEASVFAERDPYRASTHNKGIMNGIDAVLIAFGQDWRAVEAGAHAYASRSGRYTALARWRARDGFLEGRMTLPMAVGTVGGVVKVHPTVQTNRRLSSIQSAQQLASITAAVGLAQNLGALRALSAEGIQKGHMRLHARNFAVEAGAVGPEVDELARLLASQGHVRADLASQLLAQLRSRNPSPSTNAQ